MSDATAIPASGRRPRGRPQAADRARRSERRLAWMLFAPAVIVMLAVTVYPIFYSIWLSLQR